MVKIQIENGYLNVKDTSNFPITFKVSDIRDVSTRKGTFSKTITLVGDDNNNQLLGHLYDINIQTGTFNINALTRCTVLQDEIPIVEDAYLQLIAVNKLQSTSNFEQDVEYSVIVKDSQSDFFTKLGSAELTDLDFSDFNHLLTADEVINTFSNTDKYKYILPYAPLNTYPLKEFKPAIFAKEYFDRIFARAGFSYSWATIANERFERLLIPFNGDVNKSDFTPYNVVFNKTFTVSNNYAPNMYQTSNTSISGVTETQDAYNLFDPTTGVYNSPFNLGSGESINVSIPISYSVSFNNTSGVALTLSDFGANGNVTHKLKIKVFKNNVLVQTVQANQTTYTPTTPIPTGLTQIISVSVLTNIQLTNISATDDIKFVLFLENICIGSFFNGSTTYNMGFKWDITGFEATLTPSSNITGYNSTVDVNLYVPKKIKQSDFIKSIFNMYNLYVDIDPTNPNNLILITRDNYYDSGAVKDWTNKLAKDREQSITFLPELTKKKLTLSYKQDSDDINKTYFAQINEVYGQVSFTFDNEYIKDEERKELTFSPTPILKTVFGAYVPALSGASPNTNIRILYDGEMTTSTANYIIENYVGNTVEDNHYSYATHFDNPLNPTFDINYATCDYYFYNPTSLTANNLYNIYWRRTVNQINKGKMLTAYFDLRANDIANLKLNDKIRINNSWWSINSINDYNANTNQLTKVELLTIDDEVDLPPFRTKPKQPWTGTTQVVGDVIDKFFNNNNVVSGGGSVTGEIGQTANDGESVVKSITANVINGIPQLEQHVWKAKLTQSGTNPIVIESVMIDTVGFNIASDYSGVGMYSLSGFDLTDFGFPNTFDEVNYEINNSMGLEDKFDVSYYCEGTTIFIDTFRNNSHHDNVIPNSTARSFIITVTLYI
jgi:hypothetical protein